MIKTYTEPKYRFVEVSKCELLIEKSKKKYSGEILICLSCV